MITFYAILGIILWVALAFWPAVIAKRKGYSFGLFLLLALVISFIFAYIVVALLEDKNETAEAKADDQAAEEILDKQEDQ